MTAVRDRIRVVFLGSGELACPAVDRLHGAEQVDLAGVVTQPDRPRGRGRRTAPCPARVRAEAAGIPVLTPERIGAPEAVDAIGALRPDLLVVAAYGQFLRPNLLALPPLGAINIHPSLLPRYRGAAPIQWAIANGDTRTGVTILFVTERMDAGDILLQEEAPIREDDTSATLAPRLAEQGADLLLRAMECFRRGDVPRRPQDESAVVPAPKLRKEDGRVDWRRPARELRNRIRAFQPWPGSVTTPPRGDGRALRLLEAEVVAGEGPPGAVLSVGRQGLVVAAGEGALRLVTVQPEGRPPMSAAAFCAGYRPVVGARFEAGDGAAEPPPAAE